MKNNFQSNGKGRSQRVWQLLISMLIILTMGIGQMWAAPAAMYANSFESGDDGWGKSSMSSGPAEETTNVRTGGKSIKYVSSTSLGYTTKQVSFVKNTKIHAILWVKASATKSVYLSLNSNNGTAVNVGSAGWTKVTHTYSYTSSTGNKNVRLYMNDKTANVNIYVDDVIMYSDAADTIDFTKPTAATLPNATTTSLSWTNGSDGAKGTGIQNTLVWRRTTSGTDNLSLNDQGVYAVNDVSGQWTLISASVAGDATSYSGTFVAGEEYAIVHRDYAYNYSTPVYVTVSGGSSCTAPTDVTISANGGTAHIVGDAVTLTASANNVSATTLYAWYKGTTLEAAEDAGAIKTAKTAADGGTTYSIASCELESAGKYWCVVWNAEGCETSASLDLTVSAVPHTVTYKPGDGSGPESIVDLSATVVADCPVAFSYAGHVFAGWKDALNNDVAVGAAVTSDMELTAQWNEIVNYTIALDANGGTIASYEGWTKVDDVYSKEVAEGTEVSLLAFTKAGLQLMFFRDGSANEYSSAVTVNANLNLKAVWGEEKEVTLYSWESPAGTPVEVGGTAKYYIGDDDNSSVTSGNRVNYANKPIDGDAVTQYYTLSLNKAVDYSTDHVRIILDEELKSGDEIEITAYYTKDSEKTIAPKIANGSDVEICSADNLPNLYSGGTPSVQTKTLNASAEGATTLKLTRSATSTTVFITKLVITGTRVVEEMDPAQTPSITGQPTGANYTWKDAVAALTVTAAVTDGGTLHYQWYKEAGENDTKVGTDANSYTPEDSGTYYVVVTNKKTGFEDASATSNSAVVNIAARPSYTVTYYDGSTSLGTESVLEDASPAEYAAKQTKAYHEFVNWKNKADVVITPASLVVTKDTALYGNWTANYAFGDYSFVNTATVGTNPSKTVTGSKVTYEAFRVDNIYFSGMDITYESGASTALNDYKGWKINTNNATISFLVENDAQVKVGIGSTTNVNVLYTNTNGDAQDVTLTQQSEGSYNVKGGTTVTLRMTSGSTTTLKYIKIGDIPAQSDDASLSDLKVGGTTITGFSSTKYQYYVELPYGTAHADFPVVTVTTNEEHAVAVVNDAKDRTDDITVVHVTAQDGVAEKYYNVYFSVAPKVGVEVFAYTPVGSNGFKDATGYKGGKADIYLQTSKTQGGYKLGSVGHYIGIAVDGGLKANDLICIDIADLQGASALTFFDGKTDGKTQVITPAPTPKVGKNYVTVPSDMDSIYLYRADGTCNPSVISVAVYREMESFFETFTVAGVDATIDETVSPKTITVEVPAVTDITALTPTYKAWANGGATVSPTTAQDFSAGAVEYTVTSAYSEATTYQVTVTKAAASSDATLSALTVNGQAVALVDGVYDYSFELPYGTTAVPTVVATAHHAGAVATVDPCTLSGATITVVPESGVGDQQVYTLTFTISPWKEIVIWDGSNMTALATSPETVTGMAWAVNGFGSISNYNTTCGEKSYSKYLPSGGASTGRYMTLTVPAGYVAKFYVVMASHSTGNERGMFIGSNLVKNPDETSVLELSNNDRDNAVAGMSEIVGEGTWYINPNNSIDFQEIRAYLRPGYARTVSNNIGTLCVNHNVAAADLFGATFYQIAGTEPQYGKIVFDEVFELEAGEPYIFQSTTGSILMFYGETVAPNPVAVKGMIGSYVNTTLSITEANKADIMYISSNKLWNCEDLVGVGLQVVANRCYIDYSQVTPVSSPSPAPGRRRIGISGAPQVATGNENINASETPVKVMIDGQMYILRGEKMYDATGRLVK